MNKTLTLLLLLAAVITSAGCGHDTGRPDSTRIAECFDNPEFARMMDEDPAFASLNHCPYSKVAGPFEYTKAPKGYKPFYISHYGRHGSRSGSQFESYERLLATLSKAKDEGKLTSAGDRLLNQTAFVIERTEGMPGRLTVNGQKEHGEIAERMFRNFHGLFSGKKRVSVLSSEVPRCLVSMAAFTNRLCKLNRNLEIKIDCGSEIQKIIMNNSSASIRKEVSERVDSLDRIQAKDYSVLLAKLFRSEADAYSIVGDVEQFVNDIYSTAEIAGAFDPDTCMMAILPLELRYALARKNNVKIYLRQCNSLDYGDERMSLAAPLARNIVEHADSALAGNGIVADLRFGHDWPLLAISSLIGLEGVGERYSLEECSRHFITTLNAPFAGNLQIIFYRSSDKDSPVLVKCLLNEKERRLIGLESDHEPFYKWADLKERLLSYTPI